VKRPAQALETNLTVAIEPAWRCFMADNRKRKATSSGQHFGDSERTGRRLNNQYEASIEAFSPVSGAKVLRNLLSRPGIQKYLPPGETPSQIAVNKAIVENAAAILKASKSSGGQTKEQHRANSANHAALAGAKCEREFERVIEHIIHPYTDFVLTNALVCWIGTRSDFTHHGLPPRNCVGAGFLKGTLSRAARALGTKVGHLRKGAKRAAAFLTVRSLLSGE
jgi:hypothetical protein